MDFVSSYTPVGDITTLMVCIVLCVALYESYVEKTKAFKVFFCALLATGVVAIANILMYYQVTLPKPNIFFAQLYRTIYRFGIGFILECYIIYVLDIINVKTHFFYSWTTIINVALTILDVLFGYLGHYCIMSPFSILALLSYIYSVTVCTILMIRFRNRIIRPIQNGLIFSAAYALLVILLVYHFENSSYMTATFLFPILVVMFLAHANPYNLRTGALNADSFNYFLKKQNGTTLVCLKLFKNESFSIPMDVEFILRNLCREFFRGAKLFNPIPNMYILALNDKDYEEKLQKIFDTTLIEAYQKYKIDYKVLVFSKTEHLRTFRDVHETFEFLGKDILLNHTRVFLDEEVHALDRGFEILDELTDIYNTFYLDDERVIPFFQPIKNTITGKFDTAEALMRLRTEKLGFLFPDEFIPLIENNDYMHRFSMIMLHKVCKAIHSFDDIKRVSVNFSISELRNIDFVADFKAVVDANQVSYERIGVEFTESMNNSEFSVIKNVVSQLRELGCTVYLDDFGTGYNNFDRVLGLNLNVIKFDKSLLASHQENGQAKCIIDAFSRTFSNMGFQILYEGVETKEQEMLCVESHADYLQGYKYSKPISLEQYEEFIKNQ